MQTISTKAEESNDEPLTENDAEVVICHFGEHEAVDVPANGSYGLREAVCITERIEREEGSPPMLDLDPVRRACTSDGYALTHVPEA